MNTAERNQIFKRNIALVNKIVNDFKKHLSSNTMDDIEQIGYETALKCIENYYDKNITKCALSTYLYHNLKRRLPRLIYREIKTIKPPTNLTMYYWKYSKLYNIYGDNVPEYILKANSLTKESYNYYKTTVADGLTFNYVEAKDNRFEKQDSIRLVEIRNDLTKFLKRFRGLVGKPSMEAINIKYLSGTDYVLSNIEVGEKIGISAKAVSERIRHAYKILNKIANNKEKFRALIEYV